MKRAKMKPVMAWAIVDKIHGDLAFMPYETKKRAEGEMSGWMGKQHFRVARVRITETTPTPPRGRA